MEALHPIYIDDSSALRELVEIYFRDMHEVTMRITDSETEVLTMVRANAVNVVVIQFDLRPHDGKALLEAVRQIAPDMPCVFVTSYPPPARLIRLMDDVKDVRLVYQDGFGGKFLPSLHKAVREAGGMGTKKNFGSKISSFRGPMSGERPLLVVGILAVLTMLREANIIIL